VGGGVMGAKGQKHHFHTSLHNGKTRTYNAWNSMKYRCLNPKSKNYRYYGERGILICDRWLHSFPNFLADMGLKPKGMKLNRKDKDGDFEPSNCEWVPEELQTRRYD
jgi:hypothetical protein